MSVLDDVLAANSAHADGGDVPAPALPEGKRVVVVTCSEIRAPDGTDLASHMGLAAGETFVVANAGARVGAIDGDVVRSVAAALALGEGGEVFVVAHEDCEFLEADPESIAAALDAANSSVLTAAETLCGESFISARKLAIASAQTLRASPFVPAAAPVHALVFDTGRGRLSAEQPGYGAPAGSSSLVASAGLGPAPSPILGAPGPTGFGGTGPVSLFGSGPSSLMGAAPPPLVAPSPDMGAAASFLMPSPPPVAPTPAFPQAPPVPPPAFPSAAPPPVPPSAPPPVPPPATVQWQDVPPPPPPRTPPPPPAPAAPPPPAKPAAGGNADDAFRRAQETLERLRRERRR